ncbi:MAG: HAD family hydrolase [Synergistaceae bacterium]|nr:HAD family hydrolase [Synergistaceae bacterium]
MNYEVLIFDLDGTLYYQTPVRIFMAVWMIIHYALRPLKIRELFAVLKYRELREKLFAVDKEDFNVKQINEAARLCGVPQEETERVINLWMNEKPLKLVKLFRRRKLLDALRKFQTSGKTIIIYSDYPVKEKLRALNFEPDKYFWSTDGFINCMKPDASGLLRIIRTFKLNAQNILYVGDRYDRDGKCAENTGVAYMDVKEFVKNFC